MVDIRTVDFFVLNFLFDIYSVRGLRAHLLPVLRRERWESITTNQNDAVSRKFDRRDTKMF